MERKYRKIKRTKSPNLTGYILNNGNTLYCCRTLKRRTELIEQLRKEMKLKADYSIRKV